jgi:protein involved in polysaccharide export with SLBB domain
MAPSLVHKTWWLLPLLFLFLEMGCHSLGERMEIEQLTVPPGGGLGRRARGDMQVENYAAFGDSLLITLDPAMAGYALQDPQLGLLSAPQTVAVDGTIFLPVIGRLAVHGLTETQIESLIKHRLANYYEIEVNLSVRIVNNPVSKTIFVYGESQNKGAISLFMFRQGSDVTMLDVISRIGPTPLANLGRVRLVRPDPRNPLIMEVNIREIIQTGISTYNVKIKEDDIVYIPPTFLGSVTRFVERLVYPFQSLFGTAFQIMNLAWTYDWMMGDNEGFGYRGYF